MLALSFSGKTKGAKRSLSANIRGLAFMHSSRPESRLRGGAGGINLSVLTLKNERKKKRKKRKKRGEH